MEDKIVGISQKELKELRIKADKFDKIRKSQLIYTKKYNKIHREKVNDNFKKYYEKNKENIKVKAKEYYEKNKDVIKQKRKAKTQKAKLNDSTNNIEQPTDLKN